jgi:hypothetical protein
LILVPRRVSGKNHCSGRSGLVYPLWAASLSHASRGVQKLRF